MEDILQNPYIGWFCVISFVVLAIYARRRRKLAARPGALRRGFVTSLLDQPLMFWSPADPFTLRDLLNGGCLILGRAGSGKTSSSGRMLMLAIVKNRQSGGLILAAKPEDEEDIKRIFRKAGRLKDLIVFGPNSPYRFNFLRYVGKGDPRNVVRCMMMIGESLEHGEQGGGEDGDYWKSQAERVLEMAVIALQMSRETVTAVNLHRFLISHAPSLEHVKQPGFQQGYQGKVLEAGHLATKTARQEHDYQMAKDFWLIEMPGLNTKTRSSIFVYVSKILHVFNTGLAKEMIAEGTNVSPDDILKGKWVLVNFPPSSFGPVGSLISAGWKYLTELAILKRKAKESDPFCVVWCDEAHAVANSFDAVSFIPQCRSHKGCLVFLTQSVSSFYAAMKGESGKHQADALLANFSTAIIHSCDSITSKWAVAKLGRELKMFYGGSSSPGHNNTMYDQLYGNTHNSSSFNTHMDQVLDDSAFMVGRTGGPENGYMADAVIVKSGPPFHSSARNYLHASFKQS
jgi:hypothetical protein